MTLAIGQVREIKSDVENLDARIISYSDTHKLLNDSLPALCETIEVQHLALIESKAALEYIIKNDKTTYKHREARPLDGKTPAEVTGGTIWKTPAEIAKDTLEQIERSEVLGKDKLFQIYVQHEDEWKPFMKVTTTDGWSAMEFVRKHCSDTFKLLFGLGVDLQYVNLDWELVKEELTDRQASGY